MESGKTRPRSDDFVSLSSLVFFRINTILFKRKRDYRFYITLLRAATSSRTCCCSQRESEKESTNTRGGKKKEEEDSVRGFSHQIFRSFSLSFFYFFGEEKARQSVLFLPCVFWSDKAKKVILTRETLSDEEKKEKKNLSFVSSQ